MFHLNSFPIGLDISDTSLKLIQLKKSGGFNFGKKSGVENLEVNCYNKIKLPPGLIVNGEIKQADEIIKNINKLIATALGGKINSQEAIISLPPSQTFVKLLQLDNANKPDLDTKVDEEIIKHLPLALPDVYLDWQIANQTTDHTEVLVGAAPRQTIDQYTSLLEKASLQPTAIEIEATAICRSLIIDSKKMIKIKDNGPFLILDLSGSKSNIIIAAENAIYLTIDSSISGQAMTEQIANTLSISLEQAEKVKKVCGLDKTQCQGAVRELLNEMITRLLADLTKAISFFQSTYGEKEIKKIILSGIGSNIVGIENVLSEHLQIPTAKGTPWNKIMQNKNPKYQQLNNDILSYVTAIGLALRGSVGEE